MLTEQIQARPETAEFDAGRTAVIDIDMQTAFGWPGGVFDEVGVRGGTDDK